MTQPSTNVIQCCLCQKKYIEPSPVPEDKKNYYLCWYCEHEIEAEFKGWKLAVEREREYILKVK